MFRAVLAAVVAFAITGTAQAVPVRQDFTFSASAFINQFGTALPPVGNVTGSFGVSFDPLSAQSGGSLDYVAVPVGARHFTLSEVGYSYEYLASFPAASLLIGGFNDQVVNNNISTVVGGQDDFVLAFDANLYAIKQPLQVVQALFFYSTAGGSVFRAQNVFVARISVVPEPVTWSLLVVGFGLVGAAARRRLPRVIT